MHHHQYMSPLTGSSSSSNTGSPTGAAVTANLPLIASIANVKDSRWLTLEVCREYQRGKCTRADQECKFAHPPSHVEVNSGKVIACFDSLKGKCNRTNPPCKYLHPPQHLRDILLQNGRNNLILRSIAMNIAANQSIYPQTGAHVSYPNGAILSNPLQAAGSLTSYPQLAPAAAPAQSTIVFNQAGQAFTIPLSTLPSAATATAMYAHDGNAYFSPVTQFTGQPNGPKAIRTDRLEPYIELDTFYQQSGALDDDSAYVNGYVPAYQPYTGQIQAVYARNPSVDVKDTSLSNSTNTSASADLNTSTNSTVTEIKQPGQQILTAAQCVQATNGGPSISGAPQQKRSAIADPTTGIPMAAYPVTTFPYASPSPLQIPFQGQYFTAVPMTFTGYAPHLPRL